MNLDLNAVSLTLISEHLCAFAQPVCDLHAAGIPSKTSHAFRLHCSHAQKILHITHIRRQLRKLGMKVRELPCFGC